ncbi:MAG: hypothetical protein WCF12_11445 [Propionicimonas sp.]
MTDPRHPGDCRGGRLPASGSHIASGAEPAVVQHVVLGGEGARLAV